MLPEDLPNKHLRLYHITRPTMLSGIRKHGLLTKRALLDLFEVASSERVMIEHEEGRLVYASDILRMAKQ